MVVYAAAGSYAAVRHLKGGRYAMRRHGGKRIDNYDGVGLDTVDYRSYYIEALYTRHAEHVGR